MVEVVYITNMGCKRNHNEDSILIEKKLISMSMTNSLALTFSTRFKVSRDWNHYIYIWKTHYCKNTLELPGIWHERLPSKVHNTDYTIIIYY